MNPNNKLFMDSDLARILSAYNVENRPRNLNVYRTAFVHKSYCVKKGDNVITGNALCPDDAIPLQEQSNETLEHLGDAVIGLSVTNYLKKRYPGENEGFLSVTRSKLVNGDALAKFASTIGLGDYVLLSDSCEDQRTSCKVLGDVFEAFVGAMFEDFNEVKIKGGKLNGMGVGYQVADTFMTNVLETHINFGRIIADTSNFKEKLGVFMQERFACQPKYEEYNGVMTVKQGNIVIACVPVFGCANKRVSEMNAAREALLYFGAL